MLAELLILLAAVGGSTWIVGVVGWLWYRIKRLEDARPGLSGGRDELLQRLDLIREELEATQDETERLRERLDFVERLLDSGKKSGEHRRIKGGGDDPSGSG